MRTFHTGGIFTSEMSQQIVSPVTGIIRFSKSLKTVSLRTNRGEEVLVTKNSGSFLIIPDSINQPINKFELSRNTILFPKHNQYIQKDVVIAEVINLDKELKREIKPILSDTSGEVIVPKLKNEVNSLNHNKLLWILSGQLYNSPINSYINFNSNYKINKNSYIFRTKVINSYRGQVEYINFKKDLYQQHIILKNQFYSLNRITFFQLNEKLGNSSFVVTIKNQKYLLNTQIRNSKIYLKTTRKQKFANLITNSFKTKTGGITFYDWRILFRIRPSKKKIYFCDHGDSSTVTYQDGCDSDESIVNFVDQKSLFNTDFADYFSQVHYRTFFWLDEETHNLKCETNNLLVKNGDFISKNFKIMSGHFSKITGLVLVNQQNNLIQQVLVKSGLIYEGKKIFTKFNHQQNRSKLKKLFFPGEKIFSAVEIIEPSLCELITENSEPQLLIRPLKLYEFPQIQKLTDVFTRSHDIGKNLIIEPNAYLVYQPNQRIQTNNSLNLVTQFLYFRTAQFSLSNLTVRLLNTNRKKTLNFESNNKLNLNNYLSPSLKYKSLESSALIQNQQFIDIYTTLVYLKVK